MNQISSLWTVDQRIKYFPEKTLKLNILDTLDIICLLRIDEMIVKDLLYEVYKYVLEFDKDDIQMIINKYSVLKMFCESLKSNEYDNIDSAAKNGQYFKLRHICKIQHKEYFIYSSINAIQNDNFECFKLLCEIGYKETIYDTCISDCAASVGNLECLEYANKCVGIRWNENTCLAAAENGHVNILKYLYENGCKWDCRIIIDAILRDNIEILKYAVENGCPWRGDESYFVSMFGSFECFKYIHENIFELNYYMFILAITYNDDEKIAYLMENKCPFNDKVCSAAALNGYLNVLKYLHENNCRWDERTCLKAARSGNLECLKYAHESGCPWDERVLYKSRKNKHLKCFKYAKDNYCPGHEKY